MDNYVYIVAGLPELTATYEGGSFDYAGVKESIMELLSEKDQQLVELMEEGFDENSLNADFYAKAAASKNRFIREYFDFDGRLRNMKVNYLAKRLGKKAEDYTMELPEADFEEEKQIIEILNDADFVDREQRMDRIKALLDYDNYLLAGGTWITASTIKAYEEVKSPILSGLKEIRAIALERREEEDRQERERIRKEREEEERKKSEEEARERERLTQEAEKFKNGESISGSDVVDLCRRHNIAIHLRTVHNLQQVIAVINGKNGTCQYYRTKGRRRPQLDGCYKTAEELYNYLQDH